MSPRPVHLPLLLLLLAPAPASAGQRPVLTLTIDVAVARCGGKVAKPVKPHGWVQGQVASSNLVLAPHRLRLAARVRAFTPARCDLLTRAHRHAMARHVPPTGCTVLILRKVRDLDVPTYNLMGVHWRYRGDDPRYKGRRWVKLTARAIRPMLAHELAHYFGLRHDPAGGNLMTPGPSSPLWKRKGALRPKPYKPVLTPAQGRKLYSAIKRHLKRKKR